MTSASTVTSHTRISSPAGVWRLLLVHGPDTERRGSARVLSDAAVVLGREPPDGGIELADPELSRMHARLEPTQDAWRVVDLESHNGTYLNAVRVQASPVRHGDVIRIGTHLLVLERVSLESARDLVLAGRSGDALVGPSVAMAAVRADIERIAPPTLRYSSSGRAASARSWSPGRYTSAAVALAP